MKEPAAVFTHCYTADILKVREGDRNMPPQTMPLGRKNAFDLKIIEEQTPEELCLLPLC